ncbi:MAG: cytidylyltransferase domain-containing protein [Limisphaerales bacterium]
MNALVIIPARGGSKGIPRKNIKLLAGKPLVAHSILHARQTPSVTRTVVSTDDEEIAAVARHWGAEVVPRPADISGDNASSESALLHALDWLKETDGYEPELVVFLQATSPLRRPADIEQAIQSLLREQADSLFAACLVHGFVWRCAQGEARPVNYDPVERPRRQDLAEEFLEENGSIYVFRPWVLRRFNSRLGGKIAVYRMRGIDSFQIDEPGDWDIVEQLMAASCKPEPAPPDFRGVRLLVLDFDGVMTDNRVLVQQDGTEAVLCNRSDGLGLEMLKARRIEAVVISKEKNPVVGARCRKLGLLCAQGCDAKLAALRQLAQQRSLTPDQIAYVGNDLNDLECLRWVGWPIAVGDAMPEVRAVAKWITSRAGGYGAVREVCDLLLHDSAGAGHGELKP